MLKPQRQIDRETKLLIERRRVSTDDEIVRQLPIVALATVLVLL